MSRTGRNRRSVQARRPGAAKRSIDRRVARTRATLHHALISLILKKDYEAITIEEVCEAANVGRSTFYAHYTSKDHLHRDGLEHLRKLLLEGLGDALANPGEVRARGLNFSRTFFQHAHERKDLFRALAGNRGGAVALATIRQIISDVVREELGRVADKGADAIPREFIVQYVVGACMAVLTWWLENGAKLPAQQVDAMFQRLATKGIMPPR